MASSSSMVTLLRRIGVGPLGMGTDYGSGGAYDDDNVEDNNE
jgi:hypothetical protein